VKPEGQNSIIVMLAMVLVSTGIYLLAGLAATWVWGVVAHEVAKDARLVRELHARLCKLCGEVSDAH